MRKLLPLLLVLGLMGNLSQNLGANSFFIKPSAGISFGGKILDRWTKTTDYFSFEKNEKVDNSTTTNVFFEIGFSIFGNFSLSAGGGYISKGLNGSIGTFSFPGTTNPKGDFYSSPQFNFKAFSIFLTAQWTFPIYREANAYLMGGAGYYFGKFNNYDKHIYYGDRQPDHTVYYFPIGFNGLSNAMGFHGGAGIEVELDLNIFFFVEALYRRVNFKDLDKDLGESGESSYDTYIKNKLGEDTAKSTFLFYQNTGPEPEWGDIIYSIDNILLSEFVIRLGMKIGF